MHHALYVQANIYSAQNSVVLIERAVLCLHKHRAWFVLWLTKFLSPIKPGRSSSETSRRRVYAVTQMLSRVLLLSRKQRPGCFAQLL